MRKLLILILRGMLERLHAFGILADEEVSRSVFAARHRRRRNRMAAFATPDALFDNLIADGKAVPMIVVMPPNPGSVWMACPRHDEALPLVALSNRLGSFPDSVADLAAFGDVDDNRDSAVVRNDLRR